MEREIKLHVFIKCIEYIMWGKKLESLCMRMKVCLNMKK